MKSTVYSLRLYSAGEKELIHKTILSEKSKYCQVLLISGIFEKTLNAFQDTYIRTDVYCIV